MTFDINGVHWTVRLVPPTHPNLFRSNGELQIGQCDVDTGVICINEMLQPMLMRKVLCHEITHAAMFSYNILLDTMQEEVIADLIATYGDEIIAITEKIFKKLKGDSY